MVHMKYLSLFSGIGGFDIAFTESGMECVLTDKIYGIISVRR